MSFTWPVLLAHGLPRWIFRLAQGPHFAQVFDQDPVRIPVKSGPAVFKAGLDIVVIACRAQVAPCVNNMPCIAFLQ